MVRVVATTVMDRPAPGSHRCGRLPDPRFERAYVDRRPTARRSTVSGALIP